MFSIPSTFVVFAAIAGSMVAQEVDTTPAVVAKMEEMGTVYLTRRPVAKVKKGDPKADKKLGAIIGVDFRPMAGSDPKQVAALVKELATLRELETVLLLGMDVTDAAVANLPRSAKLNKVQFFNTSITDKGIAKLAQLPSLRRFHYTGTGLTDEGMKSLGKIRTLNYLTIIDAKISDQGLMELKNIPLLRELVVENTAATQKGLERLRAELPFLGRDEFRSI